MSRLIRSPHNVRKEDECVRVGSRACVCVCDGASDQCIRLLDDVCLSGYAGKILHPLGDFFKQGSGAQKGWFGLVRAELMEVSLWNAAHHSPAWLVLWCWRVKEPCEREIIKKILIEVMQIIIKKSASDGSIVRRQEETVREKEAVGTGG